MENTEYLRAKEAHKFINVCRSTFWKWVRDGRLPKGFLLSPRCRVWKKSDLMAFMQSCENGEA